MIYSYAFLFESKYIVSTILDLDRHRVQPECIIADKVIMTIYIKVSTKRVPDHLRHPSMSTKRIIKY